MLSVKLVVVGGESKTNEVQLKLPTIIGRGREGVSLTLPHALVSRKHTEIFEVKGQLFVNDLGSLNGTFVNNQRIDQKTLLKPNELLTLGNVTFRAIYEADAESDSEVFDFEEEVSVSVLDDEASSDENSGDTDKSIVADVAEISGGSKPVEKAAPAVVSGSKSEPVVDSAEVFKGPDIGVAALEKSVSANALQGLPSTDKKAKFDVQLDGLEKPESISQIDLNLDETQPAPVAGDAKLGSFLKKMPR